MGKLLMINHPVADFTKTGFIKQVDYTSVG